MRWGLLGRILTVATLGLSTVFAVSGPASASGELCTTSYQTFIRSAANGQNVTNHTELGGLLKADISVEGWYQHFTLCWKDGWAKNEWNFQSAPTGKFTTAPLAGGAPKASNSNLGWTEYFRVQKLGSDAGGNYYSILQVASGKYLSLRTNGALSFDTTSIGWNQAFRFTFPHILDRNAASCEPRCQ